MKYFFITGTSKGIGFACCKKILNSNDSLITGYSRTCTLTDSKYKHEFIDFSNIGELEKIYFPVLKNAESIVLINNSGVLGELKKVGALSNQIIENVLKVNSISPFILMNKFIESYQNYKCEKTILNISSGAGRNPGDSWSVYCASKSALDMFSLVAQKEQNLIQKEMQIRVFSVAPGVVDTPMQDYLRSIPSSDYSGVEKFINMKNNNDLLSSDYVADNLLKIIENRELIEKTLLDIRDLPF